VVVIGLDVTLKTLMTRNELAELVERGGDHVKLLSDLSQFYIDFYEHHMPDSMVLHDSCACVYVVAPELFGLRAGSVRVLSEGKGEGNTIQKPDGMRFGPSPWDYQPSQLVAVTIDADGVKHLISETICR
jgi:inosine-uridine nucleoside N-ribohydrolase